MTTLFFILKRKKNKEKRKFKKRASLTNSIYLNTFKILV